MAETVSPEINCVYVETNLDTRLVVLVHDHETIFDFKEKLCKEHHQCFPKLGEIDIFAVKVKRQRTSGLLLDYHLPDSMFLSMAFDGVSHNCWFVLVDAAARIVDTSELPNADGNCLNLELLEKDKEVAADSLLLDGYTKNQYPEEDLEAGVVEKTTKKRKLELSDGEKSRKKPKDVDDMSQSAEATGKEIEVGEKSLEDERVRDNIESDNLVNHQVNHLDTNSVLTDRPDTEEKKRSKDDINQSSAAAETTTSRNIVNQSDVDLDRPAVAAATATTASRFDAEESHDELRGNVQVEVVATGSSPTEKLDEALTEATREGVK